MGNFIDLTGQRFGRLVVVSRAENSDDGEVRYNCRCDCGSNTVVRKRNMVRGATKSCGCLRQELGMNPKPIDETPTRDALYEQYHKRKKSTRELGEMYGVNAQTITRWLRKNGIQLRDCVTATRISQRQKEAARANLNSRTIEERRAVTAASIAANAQKIALGIAIKRRRAKSAIRFKCPICEQVYKMRKYEARQKKTCSRACGAVLATRTKSENREWDRKYAYLGVAKPEGGDQ